MKKRLFYFRWFILSGTSVLLFCTCALNVFADNAAWDLMSDTWVATDALERQLPKYTECGPPRTGKYIGIFYFLWLGQHGTGGPYDITQILAENPDNPNWGPMIAFHHWGEPELGYYLSDDPYVLRKHAHMLADASVDVIIFDITNKFPYQNNYMQLCSVFQQIRNEGGTTPQIAFLTPFWDPDGMVQTLYDNFYSQNLYPDLWFYWKGKPLIMANVSLVSNPTHQNFFTFRKPIASYFSGPNGPDQWGWLEVYPQHAFYNTLGAIEEMVVGIGQNAVGSQLTAMSDPRGAMGRSWHNGAKEPGIEAVNYGYNFAEQWQRALALDPEFIFITGWNEWAAQRYSQFGPVTGDAVFVDTYTQEYSRDIEPMKAGHTDNYYYQMISNIRKFKGVRESETSSPAKQIFIDGYFSDWDDVGPEYRDTIGDTMHRNHPGWGSAGQLVNTTGRNDFVMMKVAQDDNYIYFFIQTDQDITAYTDPNWMLLFIDTDNDNTTGWEGYDYLVNYVVNSSTSTKLMHSSGGWSWTHIGNIPYKVNGKKTEIRIDRSALGLVSYTAFNFHWADNIQKPDDIIEFSVSGDSAPNRRFMYRYVAADNQPLQVTTPADQMVCWGSTAQFSVSASSGQPPYTYQWKKGDSYIGLSGATLTLTNVQYNDAGDYSCEVTDDAPNIIVSGSATLTLAPLGDFDCDGDVDQEDFGLFQVCYSGPGREYPSGCENADFNADDDVDSDDFNIFQQCMGGANNPPAPECVN